MTDQFQTVQQMLSVEVYIPDLDHELRDLHPALQEHARAILESFYIWRQRLFDLQAPVWLYQEVSDLRDKYVLLLDGVRPYRSEMSRAPVLAPEDGR